jgi:preprotein translocase subunit SecG
MNIVIWLLTAIHILVALVLVVLVLMQKSHDQGVGAAFGGSVTETMFGGSITPLVKMTIYCACILLATTLALAILHARRDTRDAGALSNKLQQSVPAQPTTPEPPPVPVTPPPAPAPTK